MKAGVFIAVLVCACAKMVRSDSVPFITPCYAKDRACLRSSAQRALPAIAAGLPGLGVRSLDPMLVERVLASQAGLSMDFTNTTVRGLRHCRVLDVQMRDVGRRRGREMSVELQCSVVLEGDYHLDGRLLLFPIQGKGPYKIIIRDIVVKVTLDTGERVADGHHYWTVLGWKHSAHVLTNVHYRFDNLFNGDKGLAQTVTRFANSNWRNIFNELSPPIVKAIVAKIVRETSKLFDRVPIRELSLD
ncbi:unnamed protein product [Leptosia nina]|uniref:Uncharacterized protein n=1 Tax=Leptosia nina TaxID=320188 RepID=A0AAV1K1P2_9NEOP